MLHQFQCSRDNSLYCLPHTQTTLFALSCSSLPAVKLCPSLMIVTVTEIFDCGQRGHKVLRFCSLPLRSTLLEREDGVAAGTERALHTVRWCGKAAATCIEAVARTGLGTSRPSMARYNLIAVRAELFAASRVGCLHNREAAWHAATTQH